MFFWRKSNRSFYGSAGKESTCNVGDLGLNPGLGRSPGKGRLPTAVFWPGEFMDCIVHGVAKSWTQLSNFHTHVYLKDKLLKSTIPLWDFKDYSFLTAFCTERNQGSLEKGLILGLGQGISELTLEYLAVSEGYAPKKNNDEVCPRDTGSFQWPSLEWFEQQNKVVLDHNPKDNKYPSVHTTVWRRRWHPTPVLLPGKSHGWRSLVGRSPWGR